MILVSRLDNRPITILTIIIVQFQHDHGFTCGKFVDGTLVDEINFAIIYKIIDS